ncbi:MAG TPA: hypothetical protein VKB09_00185, partial [Thermomicrobiales bacterium]|nr:hypothetical protein [Thermomicrobiales bacterium]
ALGLGPATTGDVVLAPGVVMNTLATAPDIDVPGGAMVMAGRIVLAPDATIPFAAGGPLVLAVESGSLDLAVTGEAMLTIDRDGLYGELSGQKALAAGDGAILPTAATSVWRANGDKTVVVLAVTIIVPAE